MFTRGAARGFASPGRLSFCLVLASFEEGDSKVAIQSLMQFITELTVSPKVIIETRRHRHYQGVSHVF